MAFFSYYYSVRTLRFLWFLFWLRSAASTRYDIPASLVHDIATSF